MVASMLPLSGYFEVVPEDRIYTLSSLVLASTQTPNHNPISDVCPQGHEMGTYFPSLSALLQTVSQVMDTSHLLASQTLHSPGHSLFIFSLK